ncbi:hypothetical protein [Paenibacillus lutrae]|uniref:DUF5983 domain-containing protein n=1 Tax=Paenibacillus lutrae TaxID=2078573 RepID=A0A7X3K1C4_9BACL|nr:hypothetical protein [Paenibacillus lutrae]MVP02093.1 hypothetical protein [Paenibacillus lutrae]
MRKVTLTAEQRSAMEKISHAFYDLSNCWTDEVGEALANLRLLPGCCLHEAEAEYRYLAEKGEIDLEDDTSGTENQNECKDFSNLPMNFNVSDPKPVLPGVTKKAKTWGAILTENFIYSTHLLTKWKRRKPISCKDFSAAVRSEKFFYGVNDPELPRRETKEAITMTKTRSPVLQLLDISTAHITLETNNWLASNDLLKGQLSSYGYTYGYFIHVPQDIEGHESVLMNIPEDLKEILTLAQAKECDWVRLDRDARLLNELPFYDW